MKGKGVGNPGKPGKRLRLEDLQSQFGVGLKEAANRLGICPTTLKVGPPPPPIWLLLTRKRPLICVHCSVLPPFSLSVFGRMYFLEQRDCALFFSLSRVPLVVC
jgi:hypothetical protein